jgi:hypothetical protein
MFTEMIDVEYRLQVPMVKSWINDELGAPLSLTLSKLVREATDLDYIKATCFARAGLSMQELLDFHTGGKVSSSQSADNWMLSLLHKKVAVNTEETLILIEDWHLNPAHAATFRSAVCFEGEVYHAIQPSNLSTELEYADLCTSNAPPLFHGFLVQTSMQPHARWVLNDEDLRGFAKSIVMMFFGIYDGESYLVLTK